MRQLSVIGEEQQPFRILVQTPHRGDVGSIYTSEQIQHRPIPGILCGGNHPLGLVEHVVAKTGVSHHLPVQADQVFLRNLLFRFFTHRTVHHDLSPADIFFHLASSPCPRVRQQLVQPDHNTSISPFSSLMI